MSNDKTGNWFRRHKILSVILGLVVLGIVVSALGGGDNNKSSETVSDKTSSSQKSEKKADKEKTAKIGQVANDGKFAFTVKSFECGAKTVGSQYLESKAQGQYCIMTVTVKNIGDEAQMFDATNQYTFNAKGQKYSADSGASYNANGSDSAFLNNINPGNSVTGKVVFDVPADVTPITAELHDSAFSGGVKVNLE